MIIQMWDGIPLEITLEMVREFNRVFGKYGYDEFPAGFCGPGQRFGERLVPDYIFSPTRFLPGPLNVSIKLAPACKIHDDDYTLAPPTWDAFHAANSRLHANMISIIRAKTSPGIKQSIALKYPAVYGESVDMFGRAIFWDIKKSQGHPIPQSAAWLLA